MAKYRLGQGMFRPSFEPVAGRYCEVTGITSRGWGQRGVAVITDPDGMTATLPLTSIWWVNHNLQVVAEYNAACDALLPASGRPAPSSPASVADELRKLAELRDSGVLSDAEFAAAKARLLG